MPKVRRALSQMHEHTPSEEWGDETSVQWGGNGLVISKTDAPRTTAFFEAFPGFGGFIRGEGATISAAEEDALGKFRRISVCDHRWRRAGYTNGGTICARCKGFRVTMRPIFVIGSIARAANDRDIEAAILGYLEARPHHTPEDQRRIRASWLRIRRAGVNIPEIPLEILNSLFELSPYTQSCRSIVAAAIRRGVLVPQGRPPAEGLEGIFDAMTSSSITYLMREYDAENPLDKT